MADYAPLDLVAATTMVRDKVRTIAHPNICMMMPCFRANLPHKSDSAVVDRLDAWSWVRIPGQAWMASTAEGRKNCAAKISRARVAQCFVLVFRNTVQRGRSRF